MTDYKANKRAHGRIASARLARADVFRLLLDGKLSLSDIAAFDENDRQPRGRVFVSIPWSFPDTSTGDDVVFERRL